MSGKGSRPRPYSVNQQTFADNWDRIFSKNKKSVEENKNTSYNDDQSTFDKEVIMKDEYYDLDDK